MGTILSGKAGRSGAALLPRTEIALALVFALFAAGIAAVGYSSFRRFESSHRAQVESQLEAIADLKIGELGSFRTERLADAELLYNNGNFTTLVRRFLANPRDAESRMHLEEWFGKLISSGPYDRVVLLDAGGVARLTARGALQPVPDPVRSTVPRVLRLREPILVDFYRDETERKAFLELLIPFFEQIGSEVPVGVLALRIDPEFSLFPFIRRWPTASRTAETLLVRRDGDDVLVLSRLKYRQDPPLSIRLPLDTASNIPAVEAALGREGVLEGVDYRGEPVLACVRNVPASPWRLVARMDLSEVYAPVRERFRLTIFLVGVLLLAAATGIGTLWRRQRDRFYKERYEAEKEKSWLQDVISRSLNEIYVIDPATLRFKYANAGGLQNLGYGMEELSGMTAVQIKPRITMEGFRDMTRPLEAGEQGLLVFETVHRRKDGSEYPVEVHLQRVASVEGPVLLAMINDITDRKAAEERLRAGRLQEAALLRMATQILEGAKLKEVLETACEAIAESGYRLCWVGEERQGGRIAPVAWAGPAAAYLEGIDIRTDASSGLAGPMGAAIRSGKPYRVRDIAGDPIFAPWREKALRYGLQSMVSVPLTLGEGGMAGIMNVYSGRPAAFGDEEIVLLETFGRQCSIALLNARRLERLRDADQRLTFQVERMPLAYIVWDREFRAREWNPAAERIFGWSAREALGMHGHEIVPPEAMTAVDAVWSNLLEGGPPGYSLNANVRKDGKTIVCEWFNTPLRSAEGEITGVLSLVHDITEKTELERQLQTAQRMEAVGTLAGGIAHDFNNALTGIIGFAEMLKLRFPDNRRAQEDIDQILRSAERASLLTRQILSFARRQVIALSNVNLNRVVDDLMKLVSKVVGAHIEIRTILAKDLPSVRADAGLIEQVIMNLVVNARDAMPDGGRLLIETGRETVGADHTRYHPYMAPGAYVVLTVSDTGVGMDQATRERVFEPFFTTKGPERGTGLGLAMVYGIVKQHKGFINLVTEPGEGATFKVYLPSVGAPPDAMVPAEPSECRGGKETLLLAEDDPSVREFVERTLTELGYSVLVARDGREAVELFLRNRDRVDLAILDAVMPHLGGKEALEALRRERPDLKAILMSGYMPDAVYDSFVLTPGIPFLQKPVGPGTLARRVREVLDGR